MPLGYGLLHTGLGGLSNWCDAAPAWSTLRAQAHRKRCGAVFYLPVNSEPEAVLVAICCTRQVSACRPLRSVQLDPALHRSSARGPSKMSAEEQERLTGAEPNTGCLENMYEACFPTALDDDLQRTLLPCA